MHSMVHGSSFLCLLVRDEYPTLRISVYPDTAMNSAYPAGFIDRIRSIELYSISFAFLAQLPQGYT